MRVLVRPVPAAYGGATRAHFDVAGSIDVARATQQHAAYVGALRELGGRVVSAAAAPDLPDSVFVEDCVVVARGRALLTRSGHAPRRAELAGVAAALAEHAPELQQHALTDGQLDGGDVLRLGDQLFVGQSGRTDAAGLAALERVFLPVGLRVVPVDVGPSQLHLKCVVASPAPGLVTLAAGTVDPAVFRGSEVLLVPEDEAYAANTLGFNRGVLVAAGFPRTAALLAARGLRVITLDVSEARKGDGSLTCSSVLLDDDRPRS